MSIRNAIFYNGVWLDTVKLNQHSMEAKYSGQNYVHTKHTLSVTALVSNESANKYIRGKRVTEGEMSLPFTNMEPIEDSVFVGNTDLNIESTIGSAIKGNKAERLAYNNSEHRPLWDIQAVRHHLLQPRGVLVYYLNDDLILASPQFPFAAIPTDNEGFRSVDAYNGPLPQSAVVTALTPNSLKVDFTIICYMNEACAYQNRIDYAFVSAHSYYIDIEVDTYGFEKRIQSGVVNFNSDHLKNHNLCPDDFREFFAPPIPFGFKRELFSVKVEPTNAVLEYRVLDREVAYVMDRTANPDNMFVQDSFSNTGSIDRSKIMRMQVWQSRHESMYGGAIPNRLLTNLFTAPPIVERLYVLIYGNNFASRYELERAAYYIMLVRLPFLFGCLTFEHEIKHDLVGNYVELHVTRTYPLGFAFAADAVAQGFIDVTPNLKDADPIANAKAGMGNTTKVYYPCANKSLIGTQNISNITVSSASDTQNRQFADPFNKKNFDTKRNQIKHEQVGLAPDGTPRFIHEFNQSFIVSVPVAMPGNSRSRGSAGTVGMIRTNLITDIADRLDNEDSGDFSSIKRVNADYRFRNIDFASTAIVNAGQLQNDSTRDFVDPMGERHDYLNDPYNVMNFWVKPDLPFSYNYQQNS